MKVVIDDQMISLRVNCLWEATRGCDTGLHEQAVFAPLYNLIDSNDCER